MIPRVVIATLYDRAVCYEAFGDGLHTGIGMQHKKK